MSIERNYITIQGWMITGLNLSGNNLLTFALIFGFCQDEEAEFKGSINYICKWLNCSRPTAIKALNSLVESNLIKKRKEVVSGVTFNRYSINSQVVKKLYLGSKETLLVGGKEALLRGSKETLPNNIFLDTIIEDKDINKEEEKKELDFCAFRETSFFKTLTNYFGKTKENQQMPMSSFLNNLFINDKLEEFKAQTLAYIEYKSIKEEASHKWETYQTEWEKTDYVHLLKQIKTKPKSTIKKALI